MIENVNMSCYSYLKNCTSGFGKTNAVTYFGHKTKLNELLNEIDNLAAYLESIGIRHGDTITIFLPTTVQSIVAFYALNKIGVIANIVHPLTPPAVLIEQMEQINSRGIFVLDLLAAPYIKPLREKNYLIVVCSNSDCVGKIKAPFFKIYEQFSIKSRNQFISGVVRYKDALKRGRKINVCFEPRGEDISVYLHGGGTTGESKTIMLSNSALNSLALKISKFDSEHAPGDEYSLVVLPLFHAFGLGVSVHYSLCSGFCCIPVPKFTPKSANNKIRRYKVTFIVGVPNMYRKMMEQSNFEGKHLKNLRLLFSGGDVVSEQFINQFNGKLAQYGGKGRLMRGYGLTEASSVCCTNTEEFNRENSIGKPIDGIVMKIWDEFQNELRPNEIGEIVVSGSTLMSGYLNEKAESGCGLTEKDGIQWVKSGDLGYYDEDGYFYFTSRKKRMIIISGYNVYPNDIENKVLTLPFIKEACAVEDSLDGRLIIRLCVSLQNNTLADEAAIREIDSFCKTNLQRYSCPKIIVILKDLPKTNMGKIDFVKLSQK